METRLVLVVEDDETLRTAMVDVLTDRGYRVQTAGDGVQALEQLADGVLPDVIVTDLMMPRMDGWELIRRLRDSETSHRVPIVVASAVNPGTGLDGLFAVLLRKPFSPDELEVALNQAFAIAPRVS